ncbi:MAG: hypothetical protein H8K07_07995 [Nitrospira sp.]|nr:hypothetical protein [Nitrospira sp.]
MKEVADDLNLTAHTIAFHKCRIMERHGHKNSADLGSKNARSFRQCSASLPSSHNSSQA